MLLQIEVYVGSQDPSQRRTRGQPTHVYHSCLRPDGVLLTIGRKTGDVVIASDKSISREHCTLRLVSSGLENVPDPRNEEEVSACQMSIWESSCVVLENKGKFGSFIVKSDYNKSGLVNGESDTDATDDEGVSQMPAQSQLPALSLVAQQCVSTKATLKPLKEGESSVLEDLNVPNGTAVMECGRNDTTIVLTRIDQSLVASGKNTSLPKLVPELYKIGFTQKTLVDASTTHLVTAVLDCSPKQLAAWSAGLDFVTTDYLQALLDRQSVQDALSSPTDYAPTNLGKYPTPFLEQQASSNLWKSCVFLATKNKNDKDQDMIAMMRSTGARVVTLYDTDDPLEAARQAMQESTAFLLNDRTKLSKTIHKELGVPIITGKKAAEAILEQRLLQDEDGHDIGHIVEEESSPQEVVVVSKRKHSDSDKEQEETPVLTNKRRATSTKEDVPPPRLPQSPLRRSQQPISQESTQLHPNTKRKTDASTAREPATKHAAPVRKAFQSQSNNDGWMTTAPRGVKKIQKLVNDKDPVKSAAPTEVVRLVQAAREQSRTINAKSSGVDYKGFRKNTVARARGHFTFTTVLANRGKHQESLQETAREFQEQKRLAEELFGNVFTTKKVVRRRR